MGAKAEMKVTLYHITPICTLLAPKVDWMDRVDLAIGARNSKGPHECTNAVAALSCC